MLVKSKVPEAGTVLAVQNLSIIIVSSQFGKNPVEDKVMNDVTAKTLFQITRYSEYNTIMSSSVLEDNWKNT